MEADRGFLRRPGLVVPAALAAAAETGLTAAFGPPNAATLGPQVSAPPPFDLFHDLRWISVYHNSWLTLALELVAVLVLRSLFVAWMVQRSWPRPDPPPLAVAARRTLAFYAVAMVLLSPWVALLFSLAVTHVSYLFFVAIPPAVVIALAIHRGALMHAAGHWWRWRPSLASLAWVAGSFAWLTLAGAVISRAPLPLAILVAAGAGILNARAYLAIVHGIAAAPARNRRLRLTPVPIAVATTFAVVVAGVQVGFSTLGPRAEANVATLGIPRSAVGNPVLVAAGYGSRWDASPPLKLPDGFVAWRYSYRGLDGTGRPLAYEPADTLQPLLVSAARLGQHVTALHRSYGEPVTIVAESEGGLVARTFLLELYDPNSGAVDQVVIVGMPKGAPAVYYPRPGGPGAGGGVGMGAAGPGGGDPGPRAPAGLRRRATAAGPRRLPEPGVQDRLSARAGGGNRAFDPRAGGRGGRPLAQSGVGVGAPDRHGRARRPGEQRGRPGGHLWPS